MTDYLPGELPSHHDAPDSWDTCTEPPWNRQVKHGKLKHPVITGIICLIAAVAVGGGIGAVFMWVATWMVVVE